MPDEWHVMQPWPSVPWCSESSWHWPAALQLGSSPENEVLPLPSRPVWQLAHGTGLWRLTSGKLPPIAWTLATNWLSLPVRIVGSPGWRWQIRQSPFLYLPLGCLVSLCTLACAWHDMHSLLGLNVKRSKSDGPLPR